MVSVKHRAMILGVVVLATILVLVFWKKPPGYEDIIVPEPNWIGSTWYGPALLIAIPICLVWLSWGVRNAFIKGIGLVLSVLVAAACVFLIVLGREAATGWM
jgi:hypothetical protein